jgi:hypothetical protein
MPAPVKTIYHGELLSLSELRRRFGLSDRVLNRWRRQGRLLEAVIDFFLAQRTKLLEARAKARAAGIRDGTRRMRKLRGYPDERIDEPVMTHAQACRIGNARRGYKTHVKESRCHQ